MVTAQCGDIRSDVRLTGWYLFGARGLSFRNELTVSYQFLDELSAQEAYARQPTDRRILLCDHTKSGVTEG